MAGLTFDVLPESFTVVELGEELFLPQLEGLDKWATTPPYHSESVVEVVGEDLPHESLVIEDLEDPLLASTPLPRHST